MMEMTRPQQLHIITENPEHTHEQQSITPALSDDNVPAENVSHQLLPVTHRKQFQVLISSFLTVCITIGFNQSYGVFQSYYVSDDASILPSSQAKSGALIAFIGTLGAGLTWGGSIVINPLMARTAEKRYITVSGVVLMSLGFGLASLATRVGQPYLNLTQPNPLLSFFLCLEYRKQKDANNEATQIWHLLLTQGLLYGIGSSMMYFPILSVCPEYFDAHRGSAMGFVLSGAGIGGLVLSPLIRALIARLSIRWTLRFLCVFNLLISLPIALTISPTRFTSRRLTRIDRSVALKPTFVLSTVAAFLQAGGNLVPLTFLAEFSAVLGYSPGFGAVLLAINNGVNSASRILTGWAGDRVGRQNTLILTVVGSAATVCGLWLGSAVNGDRALWLLFVVFYGVFAGGYNALFPTTIAEVFGMRAYASVNGFIYFVRGMGALFGSPVGGAILGESVLGNYRSVVFFDGALLFGASLCVMGVRYFDAVEKKRWKWRA